MKNTIIIIFALVALVVLGVALAGMYKFNYLANQPGYDVDGNPTPVLPTEPASDADSQLAPIYAHTWQLVSINAGDINTPEDTSPFAISFQEDGVSITTDCNNGFGDYEVVGRNIALGPIATTRMACPGETFESEFTSLLAEANSYAVSDNGQELTLDLSSGSMVFRASGENTSAKGEGDKESSLQDVQEIFIGMSLSDAEAYAADNGIPFRIGKMDGEFFAVTMDYRPGRVTAVVEEGVVSDISVE